MNGGLIMARNKKKRQKIEISAIHIFTACILLISFLVAVPQVQTVLAQEPCTDDGCPGFFVGEPEPVVKHPVIPKIITVSKDEFVYSLNQCITHLYKDVPIEKQIPRELIIAQAAIETGWVRVDLPMKVIIYLVLELGIKMITGYYLYLGQNGQVGV